MDVVTKEYIDQLANGVRVIEPVVYRHELANVKKDDGTVVYVHSLDLSYIYLKGQWRYFSTYSDCLFGEEFFEQIRVLKERIKDAD